MRHTDVADATSWTGDRNSGIYRLLRADTLHDRFGSSSRQLDHLPLSLLAATRDEVGGTETAAQGEVALSMPQQDDTFGSQTSCGQHPT
jgi:hypothetical protein